MAATAGILRMSEPLGHLQSQEIFRTSGVATKPRVIMMSLNKAQQGPGNPAGGSGRQPMAAASRTLSVVVTETKTEKGVDLGFLIAYVGDVVLSPWKNFVKTYKPWKLDIQMIFEKAIIDCRFFTLLAIAGSLVGSALCFVEGCVLTIDSYFHYLHSVSPMSEPIQVVPVLIEATDMFLMGSAMFTFGVALHVMFVGQQNAKGKGSAKPSNFNPEKLPSWIGIESPMQAKSKLGHAVMMILLVQVLEKLKSVPVNNGIDLACFAGTVFLSSASIFVLSRTVADRPAYTGFEHAESTMDSTIKVTQSSEGPKY